MARGTIEIDDSRWPLMWVRFMGAPTDEEFQGYLDTYDTILLRGQRYVILLSTDPDMPMTKPRHAKMQAAWLKERAPELTRLCMGCAFSLPAPVARGVLRAILGIQRLPMPYEVFRDDASAIAWCEEALRRDRMGTTGSASA